MRMEGGHSGKDVERARALHSSGRLDEAETIYRRILAASPQNAEAMQFYGVLLHQKGQVQSGLELVERSLALKPTGQGYSNLAALHLGQGQSAAALDAARQAVALQPDLIEGYLNIASAMNRLGRFADEAAALRDALAKGCDTADVWRRLGVALHRMGDEAEAATGFRKALDREPNNADTHYNLGLALQNLVRYDEAVACYRTALTLNPSYTEAALNLGIVHKEMGNFAAAEAMYKAALDIDPRHAVVHYNYSILCKIQGRISAAFASAREAIRSAPCFADAYMALGNAFHAGAMTKAAVAAFRLGLTLRPNDPDLQKNFNACLREQPDVSGPTLREAYRSWSERHAPSVPPRQHPNDHTPDRRLRIGYVSSDLRNHAVAYFLEPIIERHDRKDVEVFCYAQVAKPDDVTERIKGIADHWRDIHTLTDEAAADLIAADRIDVLIDCVGHTNGNRLKVFALRPAPVQMTSLIGNETTTGMAAIDFALSDNYLTPTGYDDQFTEELVRLPNVVAPFRPRQDWPGIAADPPAEPLFACFADPGRVGETAMKMWRDVLDRVPGSRLLLKHRTFNSEDQRHYWALHFANFGDRLNLEGVPKGWASEMSIYDKVSVMLDAYPITGATSSLIPLWMGVPIISMAGKLSGQRFGLTMLTNAGVPELVTHDPQSYVDLAVALIQDRDRLRRYRAELRAIMRGSALLDERAVTADLEAAYRLTWRRWCARMEHPS